MRNKKFALYIGIILLLVICKLILNNSWYYVNEVNKYLDTGELKLLANELDLRDRLSELLGDSPLLKFSADENFYVTDFVKEGFGYAFVAKSSVRNELENKELVHVKINDFTPPSRQMYMIINKNKKDSIALRSWLEAMKE